MTLDSEMGLVLDSNDGRVVEGHMPIREKYYQQFGIMAGGVTLAFLEELASWGAHAMSDLTVEQPFGVHVDIRHRKPARTGTLHGRAELDRVEGNKQFWNVVARDDEGDVVSDGVFMTKIVSYERLREKEAEREAARHAHERVS